MQKIYMHSFFKKYFSYLFFIPVIFLLYACPYSSPYKLDAEPGVNTDDVLLGNWATMVITQGRELPVKMIVRKKTDMEYDIGFTGYINELAHYTAINNDTIRANAFLSSVANYQFLNINIKGQTYIAEVVLKDNKLSLLPLAEKFTAKYIKSSAELRGAVEFHMKTRTTPVYDDQFCLKDMVRVN